MIDSDPTVVRARRTRVRRIAADAAFDETLGIAGLGVGVGGQSHAIACSETASVASNHEGEALAVLRALDYMAVERGFQPGAEVLTDSASVVRALADAPDRNGAAIKAETLRQIKVRLDHCGYVVRHVSRSETRAAHRAARMALRSWRAGVKGTVSWAPSTCRQAGVA